MNVFVSKLSFVVLFIALVLLGFYLGIRIFFISIPFLIAYLLSRPLSKLTTFISKRIPIPYSIITFIVVFSFVAIFISSVSYLVYRVAIGISGLSQYMNSISLLIKDITKTLTGITINLPWFEQPVELNSLLLQFYDLVLKSLSNLSEETVDALLTILKTIPIVLFFIFFLFISLYFFIKDQKRINLLIKKWIGKINSPFMVLLGQKTWLTFKSYIKAQLILVSITFVISVVALSILKIPFAPIIAVGVAFVDLIPMVGPAFVYMPWILFALLISEYYTAAGLFIAYLVTTLTRQVIEPKIVSSKIGTHPLITIISMYTCYRLFGVGGFILGAILVMFGIITHNVYKEIKKKDEHSTNI